MKPKYFYSALIIGSLMVVVGIAFKYKQREKEKEATIYNLLPRKGAAANSAEWQALQKKVAGLVAILQQEPTDLRANTGLAAIYIQEARESGNYAYYDKAAMKCVNTVLKSDPNNFNALVYRALIMLSQHHFEQGLEAAKKAQAVNPYNAYVYGLLVDSYVELGQYDSAIANADRMNAIRPDLTSYSRVSYLREIYGNYKAAIEAMKMAVEAGGKGDEHTEWTRVQLGALYEKIGDYKTAETLYKMSLVFRPDYPYATAGLARVATARGDYAKAVELYEKADSLVTDNSIKEELVDAYRMAGQRAKATQLAHEVIDDLNKNATAADKDDELGHYADRELAYAYLKVNDPDKALQHAMLEYNRRPNNIDVNETVAWVYYNMGAADKALPYIKVALKTNSKNPVLLSRAGLIYAKAGQKDVAKNYLQQASAGNMYVGDELKKEVEKTMSAM